MNFLLPIQILLFSFLLFAFSRVILRFKDSTISLGNFLFWVGIWVLATVGIFRPDFTTLIARKIGIGRGADAVIYASLILIFYLLFRTNVAIENLRHEITKIVRVIALEGKAPKKPKKIS